MFGESHLGDAGHGGDSLRRGHGRHGRSLRLQRRVQGHDRQGDQGQGPVHARRRAQAHQGERLVRLLHRPGRADPHVHRRRRLHRRAQEEADVRLHRRQPRGSARGDPREQLLTIASVYERLDWRTPNGCASCRPALNYYLLSTWPHEARDDPQSRFINERAHANIQKDGTYSVIPRMCGGVPRAASCAASPTWSTSTRSRPSRSPAASASTCWA